MKHFRSFISVIMSIFLMLAYLPLKALPVHADKPKVSQVTITYNTAILTVTTKATGAEVTQGLIAALQTDPDDFTVPAGEQAYIDARAEYTYLAKKADGVYTSLRDSSEYLNTSDEYYLSFNIEEMSGWEFDSSSIPAVTINGKAADEVKWNEPTPTGHMQAYIRVYVTWQDFCYKITLSPESQKVQKGRSFQFTADVLGSVKGLSWSLSGAESSSSAVDSTGKVTVGADETADYFTVRAVSVLKPAVSAEAQVTVMDEEVGIDSVTISPKTASVKCGHRAEFTVDVVGTEDHTVQWSVTGGTSSDTYISYGYLKVGLNETASSLKVRVESVKDPAKYDEAVVTVLPADYVNTVTITYTDSSALKIRTDRTGKEITEALVAALAPDINQHANAGEQAYIDARSDFTYLAKKDGSTYASLRDSDEYLNTTDEYYLSFNIEERDGWYFDTENMPSVTINGKPADHLKWNDRSPDGHMQAYLRVYIEGAAEDHKITFDANGGSGTMSYAYVKDKADYELPECTFTAPAGKLFDYWYIAKYPSVQWEPRQVITNVTEDYILKAMWRDIKYSFTVAPYDFGTEKEGYSFMSGTYLEITNTGDTDLHFSSWTAGGDTGAFGTGGSMPATVKPGQTRQGIEIWPSSGLTAGSEQSKTYVMTVTVQDSEGKAAPVSADFTFTVLSDSYVLVTFDTKGKGSGVEPLAVKKGARFRMGEAGDPDYAYYEESRVMPGGEEDYVFDWWYWDEEAVMSRVHYNDTIDEDVTLYAGWLPAIKTVNVTGTGAIYDGYTTGEYEYEYAGNIGPLAAEEDLYDYINYDGWYTKSGSEFKEFSGEFKTGGVYYLRISARSSEEYRFACDRKTGEFKVRNYTADWKSVTPEGVEGLARVLTYYIPFYVPYVQLSASSLSLSKNMTKKLTASVKPDGTPYKEFIWYSSDNSVAAVDNKGNVKGISAGTTKIWAAAMDDMDNMIAQTSCSVTVFSDPVEAFVTRLYNLCLNREPDTGGFNNWVNKLRNKQITAAEAVQGFFNSTEMKNMHLSDADYIERCYLVMMDRASDAGGKKNWLETMAAGVSNNYILRGFVHSTEFNNICTSFGIERGTITLSEPRDMNLGITKFVSRCYSEVLERKADTGGLNNWCKKILDAADKKQEAINTASNGFFHSPEYIAKNTSNDKYVRTLYRTFLGREADTGGYNNWMKKLADGTSRDEVMNGFAYSQEFANIMAGYGIH